MYKCSLIFLLFFPFLTAQALSAELSICNLPIEKKKDLIRDHLYGGRPKSESHLQERELGLYVKRAYAVAYDKAHGVPKWAAWRAQKEYLNPPRRESRWKTLRADYETKTPYPGDYSGWSSGTEGVVRGLIVPYYISGGDRNHNSKFAEFKDDLQIDDMYDACTVFEVNSMINIAPQYREKFNGAAGLWSKLETQVRKLVGEGRRFQIYAGTVYTDAKLTSIGAQSRDIAIPHGFFKIIIDAEKKEAVAFLFDHDADLVNGCPLNTKSITDCIQPIEYVENAIRLRFFSKLLPEDNRSLRTSSTKDVWERWLTPQAQSENTNCIPTLASDAQP